MKKFIVTYRGEFSAEVTAEDITEAVSKFETSKIKCTGELHPCFFEIIDKKTGTDYTI